MNLLDENIPLEQRDILRAQGTHCRAIGQDVAHLSIGDDKILSLLHRLKLTDERMRGVVAGNPKRDERGVFEVSGQLSVVRGQWSDVG